MAEGQYHASRRPESTIVQSFSADLDSMFGLSAPSGPSAPSAGLPHAGVGQLEQTVEEKKQTVDEASRDLQALEAKLRETEAKLAQVSRGNSPQRLANVGASRSESDEPDMSRATGADLPPTSSRPQNTREDTQTLMARMPGAMPQTPRQYSGSNDYVMVDGSGRSGQSVG